jgi:hypothetical protein
VGGRNYRSGEGVPQSGPTAGSDGDRVTDGGVELDPDTAACGGDHDGDVQHAVSEALRAGSGSPGLSANPRSLVNPPVVERDLGTRNVISYFSTDVEQLFAGTVVDPRRQRFHERHRGSWHIGQG